ncbi:hypothetical protein D3C81_1973060 [compost metagenome]
MPWRIIIVPFAAQVSGHPLIGFNDKLKFIGGLADPFHVIFDRLHGIKGTVDFHDGKMRAVCRQAVGRFDFAV